jgi:hypothetical protein
MEIFDGGLKISRTWVQNLQLTPIHLQSERTEVTSDGV